MQTKYMAAAPPPEEPPSSTHSSSSVEPQELSVSFRYLPPGFPDGDGEAHHQFPPTPSQDPPPAFCAIWAAGLNANPTLQNTDLGRGRFNDELYDSPTSMIRRPSTSSSDLSSSSSSSSLPDSPPSAFRRFHSDGNLLLLRRWRDELLGGGGAVGEDRLQVVCAQESSLLFCAIYDGFNGRDVADFLSATLFRRFSERLELSEEGGDGRRSPPDPTDGEKEARRVTAALAAALREAEAELMAMVAVEASAAERQTLAMVGACVAVVVVLGRRLYYMNLGDSKVVLASRKAEGGALEWMQLTEEHAAATNAEERRRILAEHSCEDAASLLYGDRVKGKVGVTRAIGAAFLKQKELNEILLPCFKVDEMLSPPYISTDPQIGDRWIREEDCFVVMASDGLFDVLSNHEVVSYVDACLRDNLQIGPAHYLLSQFRLKVARQADMSVDTLRNLRYGIRRDYHDDVSIIVIRLV